MRRPAKDPIVELYKKDVDRTLLAENLKLTPAERLEKADRMIREMLELKGKARGKSDVR